MKHERDLLQYEIENFYLSNDKNNSEKLNDFKKEKAKKDKLIKKTQESRDYSRHILQKDYLDNSDDFSDKKNDDVVKQDIISKTSTEGINISNTSNQNNMEQEKNNEDEFEAFREALKDIPNAQSFIEQKEVEKIEDEKKSKIQEKNDENQDKTENWWDERSQMQKEQAENKRQIKQAKQDEKNNLEKTKKDLSDLSDEEKKQKREELIKAEADRIILTALGEKPELAEMSNIVEQEKNKVIIDKDKEIAVLKEKITEMENQEKKKKVDKKIQQMESEIENTGKKLEGKDKKFWDIITKHPKIKTVFACMLVGGVYAGGALAIGITGPGAVPLYSLGAGLLAKAGIGISVPYMGGGSTVILSGALGKALYWLGEKIKLIKNEEEGKEVLTEFIRKTEVIKNQEQTPENKINQEILNEQGEVNIKAVVNSFKTDHKKIIADLEKDPALLARVLKAFQKKGSVWTLGQEKKDIKNIHRQLVEIQETKKAQQELIGQYTNLTTEDEKTQYIAKLQERASEVNAKRGNKKGTGFIQPILAAIDKINSEGTKNVEEKYVDNTVDTKDKSREQNQKEKENQPLITKEEESKPPETFELSNEEKQQSKGESETSKEIVSENESSQEAGKKETEDLENEINLLKKPITAEEPVKSPEVIEDEEKKSITQIQEKIDELEKQIEKSEEERNKLWDERRKALRKAKIFAVLNPAALLSGKLSKIQDYERLYSDSSDVEPPNKIIRKIDEDYSEKQNNEQKMREQVRSLEEKKYFNEINEIKNLTPENLWKKEFILGSNGYYNNIRALENSLKKSHFSEQEKESFQQKMTQLKQEKKDLLSGEISFEDLFRQVITFQGGRDPRILASENIFRTVFGKYPEMIEQATNVFVEEVKKAKTLGDLDIIYTQTTQKIPHKDFNKSKFIFENFENKFIELYKKGINERSEQRLNILGIYIVFYASVFDEKILKKQTIAEMEQQVEDILSKRKKYLFKNNSRLETATPASSEKQAKPLETKTTLVKIETDNKTDESVENNAKKEAEELLAETEEIINSNTQFHDTEILQRITRTVKVEIQKGDYKTAKIINEIVKAIYANENERTEEAKSILLRFRKIKEINDLSSIPKLEEAFVFNPFQERTEDEIKKRYYKIQEKINKETNKQDDAIDVFIPEKFFEKVSLLINTKEYTATDFLLTAIEDMLENPRLRKLREIGFKKSIS